ncbi:hypothetical protein [Aeromonas enteropelogenes]|uniref:hypothetical protein n=1 Tax=Aeromonas enteropelogenes TaxID=29489 RepID=UPI00398A1C9D
MIIGAIYLQCDIKQLHAQLVPITILQTLKPYLVEGWDDHQHQLAIWDETPSFDESCFR